MATTLPSQAPTRATAGASWAWTFAFDAERPAPAWTLSYVIAGPVVLTWDPAWVTVADQLATIQIPYAKTESLEAGDYRVTQVETSASERIMTALPVLTVAANPLLLEAGDTVPWQVEALKAIEATLAGKATSAMMSYMVAGRQVMSYTLTELRSLRRMLREELAAMRGQSSGFGREIRYIFRGTS